MKTIAIFIGTRPEAIKMAPVIAAFASSGDFRPIVVSSGQHREMLQQVIELFDIRVDHDLAVMQPNQTLASLTARLVGSIDQLLERVRPDLVLAQGDTTTTFAASLGSFYRRIPFGHVEAGLRTGKIWSPYPEEANRRLTTTLTTLHFPPTDTSRQNLLREGIADEQITVTGNTVIDALNMEVARQSSPAVWQGVRRTIDAALGADWLEKPYVLITGHRRENFGAGFEQICAALAELAGRFPSHQFIYPVHLNPNVQKPVHDKLGGFPNIRLIAPLNYREFVALMRHAVLILTDSGGIQEEAPTLGKPVLVMRDDTERPEGVEAGTVALVGADRQRIASRVAELLTDPAAYRRMAEAKNPYGDGRASARIVERVRRHFST
jgi:UDP-N-acetylglucosamine 2-epimerase (non-hydrolysing)